jgi:hypothetical protein
MTIAFSLRVSAPISQAPAWLDQAEFRREGQEIVVDLLRSSGTLLGEIRIPAVEFTKMHALLVGAPDA